MNINNRMADVVKLRANACQDLMKMLLPDDWKDKLYKFASEVVANNNAFLFNKYKPAYDIMRNVGIENYSVDMMDVTLINAIANKKELCYTTVTIRSLLKQVNKERKLYSHASSNECSQELYIQALLSLEDVKELVCNSYDENTTKDEALIINAEAYAKYRADYNARIKNLQAIILEECANTIGIEKKADEIISYCLDREEVQNKRFENAYLNEWERLCPAYNRITHEIDFNHFILLKKGSKAGIPIAHWYYVNSLLAKIRMDSYQNRRIDDTDYSTAVEELVLFIKSGHKKHLVNKTTEKLLSSLFKDGKEIESYTELKDVLIINDIEYSINNGSVIVSDKRKS